MKTSRISALAFIALIIAGCQTASLEDAAPKTVPVAGPETVSADSADTPQTAAQVTQRRNPGFVSVIPLESRPQVEDQEFVTTGASRAGDFPTFETPRAANAQMTDAERIAAEAEMNLLLQSRAITPNARAEYEARLQELRALADNHARDTQAQIEN